MPPHCRRAQESLLLILVTPDHDESLIISLVYFVSWPLVFFGRV